jgi:hypothetical protein
MIGSPDFSIQKYPKGFSLSFMHPLSYTKNPSYCVSGAAFPVILGVNFSFSNFGQVRPGLRAFKLGVTVPVVSNFSKSSARWIFTSNQNFTPTGSAGIRIQSG